MGLFTTGFLRGLFRHLLGIYFVHLVQVVFWGDGRAGVSYYLALLYFPTSGVGCEFLGLAYFCGVFSKSVYRVDLLRPRVYPFVVVDFGCFYLLRWFLEGRRLYGSPFYRFIHVSFVLSNGFPRFLRLLYYSAMRIYRVDGGRFVVLFFLGWIVAGVNRRVVVLVVYLAGRLTTRCLGLVLQRVFRAFFFCSFRDRLFLFLGYFASIRAVNVFSTSVRVSGFVGRAFALV